MADVRGNMRKTQPRSDMSERQMSRLLPSTIKQTSRGLIMVASIFSLRGLEVLIDYNAHMVRQRVHSPPNDSGSRISGCVGNLTAFGFVMYQI